jgi:prepilin-type N-terminal cleavage/methylation domain-containing protein
MNRRGTSLVEMLIVLVILAIATSMASQRLRPSAKSTVEQNTRMLAQDFDLARTRAFAARSRVRVVLSPSQWQSFVDHDRDSVIAETAVERAAFGPINSHAFDRHVVFGRGTAPALPGDTAAIVVGTRRIQFGSRGTTEPFGATSVLYLTYDSDSAAVAAVEISPAANVRVWRWVDGTWR